MVEYVKQTTMWWEPSTGHDTSEIAGYKLYMTDQAVPIQREADGSVAGAQVFDLGKPALNANGKCEVDLASLPNMTTNDGTYNLGIVAVDDAGNESSFFTMNGIALDFVAPDAPTDGGITRS